MKCQWPKRVLFYLLVGVLSQLGTAAAQTAATNYLIANNNPGFENSVAFFVNSGSSGLTLYNNVLLQQQSYGYLTYSPLIALTPNGDDECVFASNTVSSSITSLSLRTQMVLGTFTSSQDQGGQNLGIVANDKYLYAAFMQSQTLATFQITSGCQLAYVGHLTAQGLNGGLINGMALHGNILVVAYADGSIQSFNVAGGQAVSNQDEQNSSGYIDGNLGEPMGVDISSDGRYAIFGDFTGYHTEVEVSDISTGRLRKTVDFGGKNRINGSLGTGYNSEVVWLSPDETLLYISNTTSGQLTAANFNKVTGVVTAGCVSNLLKGYPADWYFTFQMATAATDGSGSPLYVVEQGFNYRTNNSYIGVIDVTHEAQNCQLLESANSEVLDPHTQVLSSLVAYPPRRF